MSLEKPHKTDLFVQPNRSCINTASTLYDEAEVANHADIAYYFEREKQELKIACSTSGLIRDLHEELAARYRGLALAIEFNSMNAAEYIAKRDVDHAID